MRRLTWFVAIVLVIFGILSVHYTIGEGIDHHSEWADGHGMPKPSFGIFVIGVAATVLGSGSVGWLLGRRPRGGTG